MRIDKSQNFIEEFRPEEDNDFQDATQIPCIILMHPYKEGFRYCHFDEHNLDELRTFVNVAKDYSEKIGFFGGYGSLNISPLFKHMKEKGLTRLTDKHFVEFFPIKRISIQGDNISFQGESEKKDYAFDELREFFQ